MSRLLIQNYLKEVEKIIQYGGSHKETSIRVAFQNLLNDYCATKNFILIPELAYRTKHNTTVYPDGTVKDALRLPWGYWESKDQDDDLDKAIQNKFIKGYPNDNILFEDSQTAVLIQGGFEVQRVSMADADKLDALLTHFIHYERPEVQDFRKAIECFKTDLPTVINTLRETLDCQNQTNLKFKAAFKSLFTLCQQSINPKINAFDIREMIIQHILTEDIFLTVFNESQFHRENIIAQQLEAVVNTFFIGKVRRETLKSLESYYAVIRREAANISNHHEKQKFLKVIYENFYKTYNPKAADRLGIVYTPSEIVRFMIESTDYLLDKHFNRLLADSDVEILDPATGTGTFITELIEYLPKNRLRAKYLNEIHCNELAILPYYIANLNIEYTYQQKMEEYEAFPHICFVDTLDNLGFDHSYQNQQKTLSLGLGEENAARIQAQNKRKISVIIGNPPYNANQQNENDNNKNRSYDEIDESIKRTYIANSTAQKTKLYDMYARFFRWASNRLNEDGMICFITNNSFLDARSFDGFRKVIQDEFDFAYIIDLGGNIRELSGKEGIFLNEKHTIFGVSAAVGIAITFLVKKKRQEKLPCKINYIHPCDIRATRDEKLEYLKAYPFESIPFERIMPDKNHNWLNIADNDFEELLPIFHKKGNSLFLLTSNGVSTNRDEWVYDFSRENLKNKMVFFVNEYNRELERWNEYKILHHYQDIKKEANPVVDKFLQERNLIKWSKMIKRDKFRKGKKAELNVTDIRKSSYRPFISVYLYFGYIPIDLRGQQDDIFPNNINNIVIAVNVSTKSFNILCSQYIVDLHFNGDSVCLPICRYDKDGNRTDNITDWGLNQFRTHYQNDSITKEDIFHYTYAVLHHPAYREKYALNLKREFPRLPFYEDFPQWVTWGKQLMDLHLNYETVKKYALKRIDKKLASNKANKPKLKADKEAGNIQLDDITTLQGIPFDAWEYKLGNRSALEWILDQYKEKKPRDQTIAEKFNTYRFADYKESVIELLQRVCTVSVETMAIIGKMP